VKTGDDTVMGAIAGLVSAAPAAHLSPGGHPRLRQDPHQQGDQQVCQTGQDLIPSHRSFLLNPQISFIAISIGITFFVTAMLMDYAWVEAVVIVIGIIVANVPEVVTVRSLT
jgi:magnesium-transporting ATPase (P-type)